MLSGSKFSSLDSHLTKLNPEQKEAVKTISGPILILAGAGSGKTRVIVSRIAYMVKKRGIPASNILAVSFTNKAANEMKERVAEMLDSSERKGLTLSTFHSLGVKMLKEDIGRLGYKKRFSIYSQSEQLSAIRTILKDVQPENVDYKPEQYLQMMSMAKNKNLGDIPDDFTDDGVFTKLLSEVYAEYRQMLKAYNALDFDDLLFLPVKIFDLYPDVLEKYREKYKYIMIDEYQDTNHLQYVFVTALSEKHRNICVVGDDDQSIYGFRGAEVKNILNFEKDFSDAKVVKLEQNYRSTNTILEAANTLIKNNSVRKEKNLWSDNGQGKKIDWIIADSAEDEAKIVTERISSLIFYKKVPMPDILVLLRTNYHSRIFEEEFRAHNIPYRFIGGTTLFDRKEMKDLVAYLRVFINPDDDINLLRIINFPARSIGKTSILKLLECAKTRNATIYSILQKKDEGLPEAILSKTDALIKIIEKYHEVFKKPAGLLSPYKEVENFLEESFFSAALITETKDPKKGMRSQENIKDFVNFLKRQENIENGISLEGFLDKMSLLENIDAMKKQNAKEEQEDMITMMTMHCSKGLEFKYVFMVGMEEEIFPHIRSITTPGGIEEERRLCYVGITRAKSQLTMSMAKTRRRWGEEINSTPSRFIEELPCALVSKHNGQFSDLDTKENEVLASNFFDKIQGM